MPRFARVLCWFRRDLRLSDHAALYHALKSADEVIPVFVFDRDILEFFLIGMVLFGLGLVGEYVGRIYLQVRDRPRYVIDRVVETTAEFPPGATDITSASHLA